MERGVFNTDTGIRCVNSCEITETVAKLCIEANINASEEIRSLLEEAVKKEDKDVSRFALEKLLENLDDAKTFQLPICQDTGMAIVFADVGQNVHITGGTLENAINRGVLEGYKNGCLRASIVRDPFERINTGDNTPAVIHTRIVEGDRISIAVAPKGFGSENMSRIKMFEPSASQADVVDFIVETVVQAGGNPCPPVIVGVGIGGSFEYSAEMSKRALLKPLNKPHADHYYADMEKCCLDKINQTGIGPQGFGGAVTALAVLIETYPTHIAGLPVAVNMCCHVLRHKASVI